jgi:hypothetical protein
MKSVFFIPALFFYLDCQGQFTIDTSLPDQYRVVFERLPDVVKKEKGKHYSKGLGLLTELKTDTLNKNELVSTEHPRKMPATPPHKTDPAAFPHGEKKLNSDEQPMWISCICRFKGDTLEIVNGITVFSGFDITTRLYKDKASAGYTEYESEPVFKTNLEQNKVSEFSIPATINNLALDRQPKKGIPEIYGKMTVTSNAYYSFLNAQNFKQGYLHKRLKLQYYFRCNVSN